MDAETFRRSFHSRNAGPRALMHALACGEIDQRTMRQVVVPVWTAAEWPERDLGHVGWVNLFRWAAFESPAGPLVLYRGASHRHSRGMAWTTDRERAEWFATRRLPGHPLRTAHVYTAVVEPAGILAVVDELETNGRQEAEVIVDPDYLPRPVKRRRG